MSRYEARKNYNAVKETNATNLQIAQEANQHEIDMWNMNNAYNHPAQQMQRFQEAGLNPALAYTQGTAGNASAAPGTHKAEMEAPQYKANDEAMIANMLSLMKAGEEVKSLAYNNNLLLQQAENVKAQAQYHRAQAQGQGLANGTFMEAFGNNQKILKENLFNLQRQGRAMDQEYGKNEDLNKWIINKEKFSSEIEKFKKEIKEIEAGNFKKWGIPENSPWYTKPLLQLLNGYIQHQTGRGLSIPGEAW